MRDPRRASARRRVAREPGPPEFIRGKFLMPLIDLQDPDQLPALDAGFIHRRPAIGLGPADPRPKILLLYGSLRQRSFSRLAVEEAARLLQRFGAETRIYNPRDLPLPDQIAGDD